jgi:hypothetical protein
MNTYQIRKKQEIENNVINCKAKPMLKEGGKRHIIIPNAQVLF